ncbi:hypothetical protein Tco_0688747 [Tanacetum coccineum]
MGCCLTSWFSKKQTALAISTTETEYVSAGKACQQALWMKQALIDYGIRLDDIPIMCDSKRAIDLSKNHVQHLCTKHIEIRHHFFRDNVQKGNIFIEKVPSEENIADILTKPLKRESFNYLCLGEVDTPTPMPKPPSPCNELSKESSPIAPSNQASPQHHSPLLIDPYVDVVLQASQTRNETQP